MLMGVTEPERCHHDLPRRPSQIPTCKHCDREAEYDAPAPLCEWHWYLWLNDGDPSMADHDLRLLRLPEAVQAEGLAPGWGVAFSGGRRFLASLVGVS